MKLKPSFKRNIQQRFKEKNILEYDSIPQFYL